MTYTLNLLPLPLGLLAAGAMLLALAWRLLADYREAILANPLSILSAEMVTEIVQRGVLGYVALAAIGAGVATFLVGAVVLAGVLVVLVFEALGALLHAIASLFGWS